ncbi:MAG: amidase [Gammaproteobacteria bacterium]|nr:amidase [Gammaproteobacteria bacterium]
MKSENQLSSLTASAVAAAIRSGELGSQELVQACLDRIDAVDGGIQAWTHLDPDFALQQAAAVDAAQGTGQALGALHGVPVAVKDIFDTHDMPTENGSVLHAGRAPSSDAEVVSRLRAAGAVILGKTVTTEFATYFPGKTRNPHNAAHTPGGSSSGSAAAVAAGMAPLALGSQTNGSVIRPAAYCGVFGFKPSHGWISRAGVLKLSRILDHVGVFARSLEDIALLTGELVGYDENDPDTRPRATPRFAEVLAQQPPVAPRLAWIKTPVWPQAEQDMRDAFAGLVKTLGDSTDEIALPGEFDAAVARHGLIMETDLAHNLAAEYERGADRLSDRLREMIERGHTHRALDYNRAVDGIAKLNGLLDKVFDDFDAIITPAATGEAPQGLDTTGSPVFCTLWTLCGVPAVTLPLLQGSNSLPIGVQLVGRRGDDARLLRTARWLFAHFRSDG